MPSRTFAQNLKNAIVNDLQSLVTAGTLGSFSVDDFTKLNPLDRTWGAFPSAILIPPTVSASEPADVANNLREYTWYVGVVTTPENLPKTDPTYLEGLMDAVLQAFDNDLTLQGMAVGGVQPAILDPPGPVSSNSITYVIFAIQLKAKSLTPSAVQQ
jgi:hypothetical protein